MALTKIRGNGIGTLGDGTTNDTKYCLMAMPKIIILAWMTVLTA